MAKWQPGRSGNPAGRPKGIPAKYGPALLEKHGRKVLEVLINKGLVGDIHALNILADRLWPRLKQVSRQVELPASRGLDGRSEQIIASTLAGEITPDESQTLMNALLAQAKIIEVSELERRVATLEQRAIENMARPAPAGAGTSGSTPRAPLRFDSDDDYESEDV